MPFKEGCSHANLQVSPNTFLHREQPFFVTEPLCFCDPEVCFGELCRIQGTSFSTFATYETHCACFWLQN